MAEPKETWKEEIATIVEKKLKEWKPQKTESPPSSSTLKPVETPAPKHTPHTLEDLINCPDCYPKIRNAVIKKEFKDTTHICDNTECALPVKGEESAKPEWKCPSCGGRFAHPK